MRPAAALALGAVLAATLTGCNAADRFRNVGRAPPLNPIENPTARPNYQPVSLPMPAPPPEQPAGANSLWRAGSTAFFEDNRARAVGDLLTVEVTISDSATLSNSTTRSRQAGEDLGVSGMFGLEQRVEQVLPDGTSAEALVGLESDTSNTGEGGVTRTETIAFDVAAVVTQVLPNGNMVVEGSQEVRVNFEVRELFVLGVVRPEDITPANTIDHTKVAELRVAYGGRGQITDVQQPRYGNQVLDILLPF